MSERAPTITPRERVARALRREPTDRAPRDFAAVPEIWAKLSENFGTEDRHAILKRLRIDCRVVSYDSFCGRPTDEADVDMEGSRERSTTAEMYRRDAGDGGHFDIWGAHRKPVANDFGVFDEFASHPLADADSIDDLRRYDWPRPDWWDFAAIREAIERYQSETEYSIRYRVGSVFETAWSLTGFEKFQMDMAASPPLADYVLERIAEVHRVNLERVLERAADLIDIVYFYDDVAMQESLLISPAMYDRFIRPHHQAIIDLARRYGKPTMMHCCGAIRPLIPRLIEMGLAILNPIQTSARGMDPVELAEAFGERLCFHGGVDVQQFMPRATPEEVRQRVRHLCATLGQGGGYILAGSHHLQADCPLDNVLAMYEPIDTE